MSETVFFVVRPYSWLAALSLRGRDGGGGCDRDERAGALDVWLCRLEIDMPGSMPGCFDWCTRLPRTGDRQAGRQDFVREGAREGIICSTV